MGLSLKKKAPRSIAEKAGRSIWNCKSNPVIGLVSPPFQYSTRSASQLSPKARPRNQATCGQFTFAGAITAAGATVEGCDVVCIVISLSSIDRINGEDIPSHHKMRLKKTPPP